MTASFLRLRKNAALANRALAKQKLVVQSFGNASEVDRDEGVFAIKPSGIPCHAISEDDVVVVSIDDGSIVWGSNRPSSDTPTHRVLYRDIESIGGVAHTHSIHATAWAQARRPIPGIGTTHADSFRGTVPVTRPLTADEITDEYEANTGAVISEMYRPDGLDPEEAPGVLVASHGPFTWGANGDSAVTTAASVELIATMATYSVTINPAVKQVEEALMDQHFMRKHGPAAYYGQP